MRKDDILSVMGLKGIPWSIIEGKKEQKKLELMIKSRI